MLIGLEKIVKATISQLFARCRLKTEENQFFSYGTRTTSDLNKTAITRKKSYRDRDHSKKTTRTGPGLEIYQNHCHYERDCSKKKLPALDRGRDQKNLVLHISNRDMHDQSCLEMCGTSPGPGYRDRDQKKNFTGTEKTWSRTSLMKSHLYCS